MLAVGGTDYINARPPLADILSWIELLTLGEGVAASRGACPVSIIATSIIERTKAAS